MKYHRSSDLLPRECSPRDLPEHEPKGVHVRRLERLEAGLVERLVEDLRGHVAPRAHPRVWGDVDLVSLAVEPDGEAKVGDGAAAVPLDEDVLGLDVPVGDGRLALSSKDLGVEVGQALQGRQV